MDFAQARYYANTHGRFISPDPISFTKARLVDPQRINLYTYTRNTPTKYTDPTGEDITITVTNIAVGTQQIIDKNTGKSVSVNTYRVIATNDSGTTREFGATRDSSHKPRGYYGEKGETPPGQYTGNIRRDGDKGFRVGLTSPGQQQERVVTPDGETRDNLQIHRNLNDNGTSEGCMLLPLCAREPFQETVEALLEQDRQNGLGTGIEIIVQPRNEREGSGDRSANDPSISNLEQGGATSGTKTRGMRQPPLGLWNMPSNAKPSSPRKRRNPKRQ